MDALIGGLADHQHGVVSRRQLQEAGVSRHRIDGRIRAGSLVVLHRGVYAVGHRALRPEGYLLAAVLACGPGAVLSHRSAGHIWGLVPGRPAVPEVSGPGEHHRRPGIVHRRGRACEDEVVEIDNIPLTSPFRTILDLAAVLPNKRQLERAINEAEVRQLRDRVSLPQLLERYPGRAGTPRLREVLASGKAGGGIVRSELEERFHGSSCGTACRCRA